MKMVIIAVIHGTCFDNNGKNPTNSTFHKVVGVFTEDLADSAESRYLDKIDKVNHDRINNRDPSDGYWQYKIEYFKHQRVNETGEAEIDLF